MQKKPTTIQLFQQCECNQVEQRYGATESSVKDRMKKKEIEFESRHKHRLQVKQKP